MADIPWSFDHDLDLWSIQDILSLKPVCRRYPAQQVLLGLDCVTASGLDFSVKAHHAVEQKKPHLQQTCAAV